MLQIFIFARVSCLLMRIRGQIQRLNHDQLSAAQVFRFADELMTETQRAELSEKLSVDFSFELQEGRGSEPTSIVRQMG